MNQENNPERAATAVPEVTVAPQAEQMLTASANEVESARAVETATVSPMPPPIQMPTAPPSTQPSAVQSSGVPAVADDVDLIEKEWVEKAKELVARTKLDPYAQSSEMSRMKADYIKKRYNKDVKVSDKQ